MRYVIVAVPNDSCKTCQILNSKIEGYLEVNSCPYRPTTSKASNYLKPTDACKQATDTWKKLANKEVDNDK
jgi:hypothetical protein